MMAETKPDEVVEIVPFSEAVIDDIKNIVFGQMKRFDDGEIEKTDLDNFIVENLNLLMTLIRFRMEEYEFNGIDIVKLWPEFELIVPFMSILDDIKCNEMTDILELLDVVNIDLKKIRINLH